MARGRDLDSQASAKLIFQFSYIGQAKSWALGLRASEDGPRAWSLRECHYCLVQRKCFQINENLCYEPAMDRIVVDSNICSGKPTIRGTRIMVRNILGMVAGGSSVDKVVEAYPELKSEDVQAALEYAAHVIDEEQIISRA